MRIVLSLSILALTTAATPPPPVEQRAATPDETPPSQQAVCRDRIELVRQERGLPKLERGAARPNEPLLIAAVDHRIQGCSVMVMHSDTSDVRPLPAPKDGTPALERIPAQ